MCRVVFVRADGSSDVVHAEDGESLMSAAVRNDITEIVAECGGACACGTCHCYISDDWLGRLEEKSEMEQGMLECVIEPRRESRLSCQIRMCEDLDGIVVRLPENQY